MRVSLINVNLMAYDAIGRCILHQARFFRRRGDDVRIYTMHAPSDVSQDIDDLAQVVDLADLIDRHDKHFVSSDLYVYHYPGRYPLIESIRGLERGAVLFYYHNVTPPDLWASAHERESLRHSLDSVSRLAHYADLIVTPSPFNKDALVNTYGFEPDRIRVLPLAVPLDEFTPGVTPPSLLDEYRLEGRRVILFVGRMAGNKRIDLLIEALPRILKSVPASMLMLVGDDSSNPAIRENVARAQQQAQDLGVLDRVIFTGRVDSLSDYYRLASVYASASLHEGFGVPLIEAMASGTPVVASRATAHPWVVGEAGLLAEPDDPEDMAENLANVLMDDKLYGTLVRRGLDRARQFSLERYYDRWRRIVRDATAWLPNQPYPRPSSLLAQPIEPQPVNEDEPRTLREVLFKGQLGELEALADIMDRDYAVHSNIPLFGPLIAKLRKNLTSHLRGPYIDPTFERQVAFNEDLIESLREIVDLCNDVVRRVEKVEHRIEALERFRESDSSTG